MMNEWKGMIEGCGSFLNDRTIFISFHLCRWSMHAHATATRTPYNDRTRAIDASVFERCTSLTATFMSCRLVEPSAEGAAELVFGRHNQTEPQFPKPIWFHFRHAQQLF